MILSKKNGLTSLQINEILKDVRNFGGCHSKDRLPPIKQNYWYVMNMENSTDKNGKPLSGTHWVSFITKNNVLYYFDPFGIICPVEVLKVDPNDTVKYNTEQMQNEESTCCGFFSIALILSNKGDIKNDFQKFIRNFSNNTSRNDMVLKMLLYGLLDRSCGIKIG
jgi:hypothetical protein